MKIQQVGHIAINTGDFQKSFNFYSDLLGFKETFRVKWEEFSIINLEVPDGRVIELFDYGLRKERAQSDNSVVGYRHLAFQVDDVEEWEEFLQSKGIEIRLHATVMEDLGIKGMLCLDPDGTEVELYEPLT